MAAYKKSEISKYTNIDSCLRHELVQAMACYLDEFDFDKITKIYNALGYSAVGIAQDLRQLIKQKIVIERENKSYYATSNIYYVSMAYLPKIFREMTEKQITDYIDRLKSTLGASSRLSYYQPYVDAKSLVLAVRHFLNNDPKYKEELNASKKIIENVMDKYSSYRYGFLINMMYDSQYTEFFKAARKNVKAILAHMLAEMYADMRVINEYPLNKYLFFDENGAAYDDIDSLIYVLQNQLMARGHIEDLIDEYAKAPMVQSFLKAIKALHEGEFAPIYRAIAALNADYGSTIYDYPHLVMFFGAALLLDDSTEALEMAKKLQRDKSVKTGAYLLNALLDWRIKGAFNKDRINKLSTSAYNPSTFLCFTLFALHFNMFREGTQPTFMEFYVKQMAENSRMNYMRMLFSHDAPSMEPLRDSLCDITGMKSFFYCNGKKERWEVMLDQILIQCRNNASEPERDSRVAYLISKSSYVQPIVQKRTATGKWSKGRNIALKNFRNGNVEGMMPQDSKVALNVSDYYQGYGNYTEIDHRKAMIDLVGHPYVFTDDANRLKVDIIEEPLQLSVSRSKNGKFKINTNIVPSEVADGYYIDKSNETCITVIKVTNKQLILLNNLLTIGELPAQAEDKLGEALTMLGASMTVMSDLNTTNTNARQIEGNPAIVMQLIPDGEIIRLTLFVKPLGEYPPYLNPAKGGEFVNGRINKEQVQAHRNLDAEQANLDFVEKILEPYADCNMMENIWELPYDAVLDVLDAIIANQEKAYVEWPEGVKLKINRPQLSASDFHFGVKKINNWFELEGKVDIDEKTSIKISELLRQLGETKSRFIRLKDDEYVALSQQLAKMLQNLANIAEVDGKKSRISPFNSQALENLENVGVELKADRAYRQLMKKIESADKTEIKVPRGIQADLRDYQKEGFRWMARLNLWGAGACLADDMGLGKTLQSITLLHSLRAKGASLVVAPTSILNNWQDEINRFSPSLKPVILNQGSDEQRKDIIAKAKAGDVVITSYGILVNLAEELAAREWNVIVLDEAHTIKNRGTKMSKAAMTLKGDMRVALTGTPIQNRLSEIWNIFQFINPGILGSFESFSDRFIVPIEKNGDKDRQRSLKKMITPFILRRTKNDVLNELPEKTEITIKVDLSNEERAVYEQLRQAAEQSVSEGGESAIQALAEILRLRQAACNVKLINPKLDIESSKSAAFMQLVENLQENNHRALVFSQFTSHLALIREQLDKAGYQYLYLDGSTPASQRAALVEEFQNGDVPLFLISLKAGGLGLNLTGADYVIHLDPWWNPAVEDQASDRSHRIGQQKPVTVYRIIAADTIEEKILRLHGHKKSLADALLEGADMSARLTKEEILGLLQQDV